VVSNFFPDGLAAAFTEQQLEQLEQRKAKAAEKAAKA
jgi:ribosomal protein L9